MEPSVLCCCGVVGVKLSASLSQNDGRQLSESLVESHKLWLEQNEAEQATPACCSHSSNEPATTAIFVGLHRFLVSVQINAWFSSSCW